MNYKVRRMALWVVPLLLLLGQGCGGGNDVIGPTGPPADPSQLTVTSTTLSGIALSWVDNSSDETAFKLERAPGGTTSFTVLATLPAGTTAHTDTGLTKNTQFCYRVQAINSVGASGFSNTICGQTDLSTPVAPSSLAVTSTTTSQINLSWADNSFNEDGFKIERAPGTTTSFSQIASVGPGVVVFSDTGLPAAQTFTYRVRAFNATGDSPYSNTIAGATGIAPPTAPSGLVRSSRTTSQIVIAWNDNSSNETGFRIERAPGTSSSFAEIATVGAGVTTFTNSGLGGNQTFTYHVRAFNAGGDSPPSNNLTAKTLVSYAGQVHPLFSSSPSCTGCHTGSTPSGGLNLNGTASSVFPAVSARVNVGTPCDSLILKKPSRTTCAGGAFSHSGGTLWPTSSTQYGTTLLWIQEGAANN